MVYPRPFLRLVVSGTLYTTEGFSWGLSLATADADVGERPLSVPEAIRNAVGVFHTNTSTAPAKLTTIKLNEIGTDGRYTQSTTVLHDYGVAPVTPASSAVVPAQIALAVSLDTEARRGLAARGRFYVPVPKYSVNAVTGAINVADATAAAAEATQMINSIRTALPGYVVCVASDQGAGAFREVRNVRVGRVLDTIRSRRTSLAEEYQVAPQIAGYGAWSFSGGGGDF